MAIRAVACLVLILLPALAPTAGAATARQAYEAAVAREEALRAAAASGHARQTAADYRAVAARFEAVVRRHHGSGYADNALWRAAGLLLDASERFGTTRDRATAKHLLKRLVAEYPSSRLARQGRERLAQLEQASASPASAPSAPQVAPRDPVSSAAPAAPPMTGTRSAAPPDRPLALIRAIHRAVQPDLVRITFELDAEVIYRTERVENPPRVLFDLSGTMLGLGVREGSRRYTDDVVRLVRVGRHPDNLTRIVLDLHGVKDYSVFTLYNPFRIVVDCVREVTAAPTPSAAPALQASRGAPPMPTPSEEKATLPPAVASPPVTARGPERDSPPAASAPPARRPVTFPARRLRSRELARRAVIAPSAVATPREWLWPLLDATSLGRPGAEWQPAHPVQGEPLPAPPDPPETTGTADRSRPSTPRVSAPAEKPASADKPTAAEAGANGYSLARQLGLGASRIVLDPGHGGHDPGAEGAGLYESHVVLDVALRLEKLLKSAGVEVIMTRRTDQYIPLEERTAIANRAQGDLFLSIHANASRNRKARGIETYVLNFASNPEAEAVAARENASSGRTMSSLTDIVKAITLNNKLDESRNLAGLVQRELNTRLKPANGGLRNLGVKQAPFVVLIGASMPSILVEVSFITHREEGRLLKSGAYRQRIAEALFNGIRGYQKSLKGPVVTASQ